MEKKNKVICKACSGGGIVRDSYDSISTDGKKISIQESAFMCAACKGTGFTEVKHQEKTKISVYLHGTKCEYVYPFPIDDAVKHWEKFDSLLVQTEFSTTYIYKNHCLLIEFERVLK